MAASVSVLCPNGRRVAIRVAPATPLLQVLEEACKKQKMEPSKYALKHGGKLVDLTALFRYSSIPKNGHLEMVAADRSRALGEVVLAVQCADGTRHQAKFADSVTSLWDVLMKVGVVSDVGEGVASGEPVVVYMTTHVCGEGALRGRSLKDLGLTSGRAAIRFLHRQSSTDVTEPSPQLTTPTDSPAESSTSKSTSAVESVAMDTEVSATTEISSTNSPMESNEEPKPKVGGHVTEVANHVTDPASHVTDPTSHVTEHEYYFPAHPISYFPEHDHTPLEQAPSEHTSMDHQSQDTMSSSVSVASAPPTLDSPLVGETPPSLSVGVAPAPPTLDSPLVGDNPPSLSVGVVVSGSVRPPTQPVATQRVYDEPCERERIVYHLDDKLPLPPTEEVPDEFFAVTPRDVLIMHDELRKQVAMEDAPLLTSAMRQVVKEKRFECYTHTVLRVHLPDRWVLQGVFRPQESLKALVRFVRESLADPGLKFYLYTTPPKSVLRSGRPTLLEMGFVPAAIVYLGVEGDVTTPILSQECLETAQSPLQAELAIAGKRGSSQKPLSTTPSASASRAPLTKSDEQRKSAVSAAIGKTVPKWFKLGK